MRTFRRRTKSWAIIVKTSMPLANDLCIEFQPLWEPSIRLPSDAKSSDVLSRHPFCTCRSCSACVCYINLSIAPPPSRRHTFDAAADHTPPFTDHLLYISVSLLDCSSLSQY